MMIIQWQGQGQGQGQGAQRTIDTSEHCVIGSRIFTSGADSEK